MPAPTISERTRAQADPVRNFKFNLQFIHPDTNINDGLKMGFTSVDGLGMATDVQAYREGGWNTNPHKLPGQSDFPPITCTTGVFYNKKGLWNAAKQMFAVQWGSGTIGMGGEFRFDLIIRVMDHPVTAGTASGSNQDQTTGAVLAFKAYNGWIANVQFGGLNAGDNGILVSSMTIHHEGLDAFYGPAEVANIT